MKGSDTCDVSVFLSFFLFFKRAGGGEVTGEETGSGGGGVSTSNFLPSPFAQLALSIFLFLLSERVFVGPKQSLSLNSTLWPIFHNNGRGRERSREVEREVERGRERSREVERGRERSREREGC